MSTFRQLQNKILNFFQGEDEELRTEVKDAINETIWEINSENPNSIHAQASSSITLTAGTSTVSSGVPSDFDRTLRLYIVVAGENKRPLVFLDRSQWLSERLFDLGNSVPTHYNIFNGVLYVGPPPDSAYSGTLEYYKTDSELSDNDDTGNLTSEYPRWERIILRGAKAKIHQYLASDSQMISLSSRDYEVAKARFKQWTRRNLDKSPESSRIKNWTEVKRRTNPLLPEQLRR